MIQDALVRDIKVYTLGTSTFFAGIYSDAAGEPGNLLASSAAFVAVSGKWVTVPVPLTALTPGTYWLVVGGASSCFVGYSHNTNIQARYSSACGASLPSTFPASTKTYNAFDFQADFCASVPAVSPTFTVTSTPTAISTPVATCGYYGQELTDSHGATSGPVATWAQLQGLPAGYAKSMRIQMYAACPSLSMGIYADNNGVPGGLLVQSAAAAVTAGWNTFTIPSTYLGSGNYWIANAAASGNYMFYGQNLLGAYTFTSGSFPDPFPGGATSYYQQFVMDVQMCP